MRVALISDIEGNLVALEAVLADIERAGVNHIVCLGDVAEAGPQPAECVRRLAELGCPVVMGNIDEWLRHPPDPAEATDEETRSRYILVRWGAAQLSASERATMGRYQPTVRIALGDGDELLCFHGSPRSFDEIILPTTPDEELGRYFDGVDAAVMAGGHTHLSMVRPLGNRLLVNPGSVGITFFRVGGSITPRQPWAEYGIVSWDGGLASVELRRVRLDREALLRAARASGMPNRDEWIAAWG